MQLREEFLPGFENLHFWFTLTFDLRVFSAVLSNDRPLGGEIILGGSKMPLRTKI